MAPGRGSVSPSCYCPRTRGLRGLPLDLQDNFSALALVVGDERHGARRLLRGSRRRDREAIHRVVASSIRRDGVPVEGVLLLTTIFQYHDAASVPLVQRRGSWTVLSSDAVALAGPFLLGVASGALGACLDDAQRTAGASRCKPTTIHWAARIRLPRYPT